MIRGTTLAALALTFTTAASALPTVTAACNQTLVPLRNGQTNITECFRIPQALQLQDVGSNSVVEPLNDYLNLFCGATTPECEPISIYAASMALLGGCGELVMEPATVPGLVYMFVHGYPFMRPALCSKNQDTGDFCVTETLRTLQAGLQDNLTLDGINNLLQEALAFTSVSPATQQAVQVFNSGSLCTTCAGSLFSTAQILSYVTPDMPVVPAAGAKCGTVYGFEAPIDVPEESVEIVNILTEVQVQGMIVPLDETPPGVPVVQSGASAYEEVDFELVQV